MGLMDGFKKTDKSEFVLPVRGKFKGEITVEGNARINGEAVGTVLSHQGNIVCGPQSEIDGTVEGVDIAVFGTIDGDVTSKGQLSVFSGASLKGDVIASALVIESGASYTGSVVIRPKEPTVLIGGKFSPDSSDDTQTKPDQENSEKFEDRKH